MAAVAEEAVLLLAGGLGVSGHGLPISGLPMHRLTIASTSGGGGGVLLHRVAFLLVAAVHHFLDLVHAEAGYETLNWRN